MARHISAVCRAGFFQLRQLRSVRRSLTTEAIRALVQAFISCRLDYCNSLLAGVADVYLRRLQSVQNAAAHLVSGAHRHESTTTPGRFLLAYTGFQCASESFTRRRCSRGSVYMMQPLAIWLTCVCRPTLCMVASNYIPRRLGLCWSRVPGLLPVSAASPSMDHEHGENTRYDPLLLQASSQGPPVSAVLYAAAGWWAQHRLSGAVVTVKWVRRRLQIFRLTYLLTCVLSPGPTWYISCSYGTSLFVLKLLLNTNWLTHLWINCSQLLICGQWLHS